MQLRSLSDLDTTLAWRHVLFRMRRFIDVPDRLPFEVVERVTGGSPRLTQDHHLRPIHLVMATKGSGTVRPFVRITPTDLLLYQALVDSLAGDIEGALGPRDKVFAYRQALAEADDPFADTPTWRDFMASIRAYLAENTRSYVLTTDVSSYFVYVDIDELEKRLLAVSTNTGAVRDLGDLLRGWQQLGVRGLPQGVAPSSALGNFYLAKLDSALEAWGADHRRYMDDVWVFATSYSEARRLQDRIERLLFEDRLGIGGEKLKIRRAETAMRDSETAEQRLELRRVELREEVLAAMDDPYVDEADVELDEQEIDEVAVHDEYDELLGELRSDRYPPNVRARLIAVYRELERGRDPYGLEEIPIVLTRMPHLTETAMRYLARAREEDAGDARAALLEVMGTERFHRDQEWLHMCRAALRLPHRPSVAVAERLAEVATTHPHPLVRARALLAWGSQSESDDFGIVDNFWPDADAEWRPYVLLAIQAKRPGRRDERYDSWSGEARFLRLLADEIRRQEFPWRSL